MSSQHRANTTELAVLNVAVVEILAGIKQEFGLFSNTRAENVTKTRDES